MSRSKPAVKAATKISLDQEIAHLRGLGAIGLRARWHSVMGREAPHHISRHLLFAVIAYRVQAEIFGDLDADTLRLLSRTGSATPAIEVGTLTASLDRRRRQLLPGTLLTREWNGQNHRVMVVKGGFEWDGGIHDSLSKIAHAITGTRWNGPRFFGLRDKRLPS